MSTPIVNALPILTSNAPPVQSTVSRRYTWVAVALAIALGGIAYSNTFAVPFVFDGRDELLPSLEASASQGPMAVVVEGRARLVVFLSFYAERLAHGLTLSACHATNLMIHVAAALALFGIVRHTLRTPRLAERYGRYADRLALTVALVWLVHPLQTQSVTYLYQRYESLMGLWYLLTVYAFVRGTEGNGCKGWLTISALCCWLAVFSKEVAATAPILVLWYDRVFVARSWREILRRRWGYYVALAASCVAIASVIYTHREAYGDNGVLWIKKVTSWDYACTQPEVILHYLRLVIWPVGQCLDDRWPVASDPSRIALSATAIVGGLVVTLWAIARRPALGFLLGTFFLLLAPTSSIAPLRDLAFEHRMYLPIAPVVLLLAWGIHAVVMRLSASLSLPQAASSAVWWGLVAAMLAALTARTIARNHVYRTHETLWADVLIRSPNNDRAFSNLGRSKFERGDLAGALQDFHQAIELAPDLGALHHARGLCRQRLGAYHEAIVDLTHALELNPKHAETWACRGSCYLALAQIDLALADFTESIRREKNLHATAAYAGRAKIYFQLGRLDEARADAKEYFRRGGAPDEPLKRLAEQGSGTP